MTAPDIVKQLVERFEQHRDAYRAGKYNETQLRNEFLNPFFEALGWDVLNKQGNSEEIKHVIHEDSLEIEGVKKAPDYAFKIGKERKFFVEAKKPSVKIETNPEVAFQLRRYVWSAKLPLGILTDFEEFAIYECRSKPKISDSVKTGRVLLLKYTDYIEKWDEIASIFSHDAVMTGGFDKFAKSVAKKKGTAEVDSAFLAEIEGWREALAKNIALRNKLKVKSEADLNYAVQMTIDRIIFLRICEDRGYESEYQLQELANPLRPSATSPKSAMGRAGRDEVIGVADLGEAGRGLYRELVKLFERADRRYNSGLFHFKEEKGRGRADTFTTGLEIDDKVLKDIIRDLYYPSPYVFALIPADILGQIYEQFLGKVIRLTASGNAKVEEKPEVRKAGGVYYTPTFIVYTIILNTLGKLLTPPLTPPHLGTNGEGKMTPKEAARLKILDPACGSGTFLLGAYQYLLDWHLNWYINNDFEKWSKGRNAVLVQSNPARFKSAGGVRGKDGWKLSVEKKKEILLNNIYGVDIDPQAVEVTKLSLLLKVIEDPGQLSYLDERILPDLGRNIQCGNSLIGPDYWDGQLMVDEEERTRVNAFDWKSAFPEVFAQGGFDVVVGNPPYGAELNATQIIYLKSKLPSTARSLDTYEMFLVIGESLLNQNGRMGMIIPASWLTGEMYYESRKKLVNNLSPIIAYAMPFDIFKSAYIDTAIVIFSKESGNNPALIHFFPKKEKLSEIPVGIGTLVDIASIREDELHRLTIALSQNNAPILKKLKSTLTTFGDWFDIQRGVQPYSRSKHTEAQIQSKFLHSSSLVNSEYLPELQGNEMARYWTSAERTSYLHYCDQIASTRSIRMFQGQRLVIRRLLTRKFRLQASMVSETMITTDNVLNAVAKSEKADVIFALGILNSKIISWLYVNTSMIAQKDDFPQVHLSALKILPIPPAEKAQHDKMVSLVERMLALHKSLASTQNPQEADRLTREVESVDKSIDELVYELYGLTEDEIKIVEGG
jgi:hypothetical protein